MKCSAYIATSVDGFIARLDGGLDWLEAAGTADAEPMSADYLDFAGYLATVDCLIMGRNSMETISSFNLTDAQWPYGDTRIVVLSRSLKVPPENLQGRVEMYSGEISDLIRSLESEGVGHAYVDGGATIRSFLRLGLIDRMVITQIPVLLGEGIPLFGSLEGDVRLCAGRAATGPKGVIQLSYEVVRSAE
ncbi:MAG: dihydrofolate reductase [Rhodobacteraceae bacterium]|nr:dihydrofolate reductase [Paracoccaceae bacterium]